MIRKALVFGFMVLSISIFANTYYIPHLHTGSDYWANYLILDNMSSDQQTATVTLYDADGNSVYQETFTVEAEENLTVPLNPAPGVLGTVTTISSAVRVRLGFIAKESEGGGTAEFDMQTQLYNKVALSMSNYYEDLNWSGYAIMNASDEPAEVTVTFFNHQGKMLDESSFHLDAWSKKVDTFSNGFGIDFKELNSVVFSADSDCLTGITISGNDSNKLLFTNSIPVSDDWNVNEIIPTENAFAAVTGVGYYDGQVFQAGYTGDGENFNGFVKAYNESNGVNNYNATMGYEGVMIDGLVIGCDNGYAFLYGFANGNYWICSMSTVNGGVLWQKELDVHPLDDFYKKIQVASAGSTVMVQYRESTEGHTVMTRFNADDGTVQETSTIDVVSFPTILMCFQGDYLSFWSELDENDVYSNLVTRRMTTISLSGTDISRHYSSFLDEDCPHHFMAQGGYEKDGWVYLILKFAVDDDWNLMPYRLDSMPAIIYGARMNPAENAMAAAVSNVTSCFGGRTTITENDEGTIIGFTTNQSWPHFETQLFELTLYDSGTDIYFNGITSLYSMPFLVNDAAYANGKIFIGFTRRVFDSNSFSAKMHKQGTEGTGLLYGKQLGLFAFSFWDFILFLVMGFFYYL